MQAPQLSESERVLRLAATFFAVAVLIHNGDHLRRGSESLNRDVFWAGSASIILEVGVVALVYMHHRIAPLAAVATGFPLAAGYLLVHFTPERSWLSDSFVSGNGSVLSSFAAGLEVVGALFLGWAGLRIVRERGLPSFAAADGATETGTLSVFDALRHPVVAVLLVGNIVVFLGTL